MDVREAIETRLEVRDFSDRPVSAADRRAILEAGRLASSGRNTEHWRFIVVEAGLDRLAESSPTGGWVADADFAVVVCTDPTYDFNEIDAGRTVTYMQLAAWSLGVGSCLYTVDNPELDATLRLPDDYDLTAVLGFGYPPFDVPAVEGRKDRAELTELVFEETFGQPRYRSG